MKKNNVIHFKDFLNRSYKDEPTLVHKAVIQVKKNKRVYIRIGLVTTSICLSALHPAFAAGLGTGIDQQGYEIYRELLSIGKWVIIVKGGWDVIRATLANDYEKAKKGFVSYLLAYIFLLILPEAMNKADDIVKHISVAGGN